MNNHLIFQFDKRNAIMQFIAREFVAVPKEDIQKVRVTALFIAAKYEEVYP